MDILGKKFVRNIAYASNVYTRKNAQVETNLQRNYSNKSVPKLFASCVRTACSKLLKQSWNKLLTTCNKLDGTIRLVKRLLQS